MHSHSNPLHPFRVQKTLPRGKHRIIEWPGLKRTTMIIEFQPPAMCRVANHQTRLPRATSSLQGCLRGWGIHSLLGQPVPVCHHPLCEGMRHGVLMSSQGCTHKQTSLGVTTEIRWKVVREDPTSLPLTHRPHPRAPCPWVPPGDSSPWDSLSESCAEEGF